MANPQHNSPNNRQPRRHNIPTPSPRPPIIVEQPGEQRIEGHKLPNCKDKPKPLPQHQRLYHHHPPPTNRTELLVSGIQDESNYRGDGEVFEAMLVGLVGMGCQETQAEDQEGEHCGAHCFYEGFYLLLRGRLDAALAVGYR